MKASQLFGRDACFEPHDQEPAHISNGVESTVEISDFIDRIVQRRGDFEEAEIFGVDQLTGQKLSCDEVVPLVPIVATWSLEAHNRLGIALACLSKGQNFETFVMSPESAREQGNRVCLFLKDQFASKEIFERDKFWIIGNGGIRALFERQHDIDPEAVFASGALLARAHDPVGAPGYDHEPLLDDLTGKLKCHLVIWIIHGGAGRAEDADLASIAIVMEDSECVAQFFDGAVDDLEVQYV